jgi:thermitase
MAANRWRFSAGCGRLLLVVLSFARLLMACLLVTGSAAPLSAAAATEQTVAAAVAPNAGEYVPAEVLIGWQAGTAAATGWPAQIRAAQTPGTTAYQSALQSITARTGLKVLEAHLGYAAARLAVPAGQEQAEIARLVKLPGVRYAELNYIAHAAVVPSDPLYAQQWNMARVNAPAAWDLTTGSNSVIVAVIDSGIDSGHAEFTGRLIGPGSGARDFIAGDNYPIDDFGHGTHVTGILAAGINGVGVVGLAPDVHILPLKVLDSQGRGTYDNIVAAINWAADWSVNFPHPGDPNARVRVINLSLGGFFPSQSLQDAVNYAISRGILVVAAAGNCGQVCEISTNQYLYNPDYYPAAYSGVLAVGATDRSDNWADYSGYKSYVAISAPGGVDTDPILSALPYANGDKSGYGYEYGTSMAAPLVAGAAALAWSLWPAAIPAQISDTLVAAADKVPLNGAVCAYDNVALQHSPCYGYGRLNALRVARSAYPPSLRPAFTQPVFLFGSAEAVTRRTYSDAVLNPSERLATWQATVISGAQWLSSVPDGMSGPTSSTYNTPGILSLTAQPGQLQPGSYTGVVQVRSVFPFDLAANFNITATLVITNSLYHVYAPAIAK